MRGLMGSRRNGAQKKSNFFAKPDYRNSSDNFFQGSKADSFTVSGNTHHITNNASGASVIQRQCDACEDETLQSKARAAAAEDTAFITANDGKSDGIAKPNITSMGKQVIARSDDEQKDNKDDSKGDKEEDYSHADTPELHWGWPWFDLLQRPLTARDWRGGKSEGLTGGWHGGGGLVRNPELAGRQLAALYNFAYAPAYGHRLEGQGYDHDYLKHLSFGEKMSGLEADETWFLLGSAAFGFDTKKYLEGSMGHVADEHLWPLLTYGLPIWAATVAGMTAGSESDVDYLKIVNKGLKKYSAAPGGVGVPYMGSSITGELLQRPWTSGIPSEFNVGLKGRNDPTKHQSFSMDVPFNIGSTLGWYPDDEEVKKTYIGPELFPYFKFGHKWKHTEMPESYEGDADETAAGFQDPEMASTYRLGLMGGNKGYYGLAEMGQGFNADGDMSELYLRQAFMMRHLSVLKALQLSSEQLYRPGEGTNVRADLGLTFDVLKSVPNWNLELGGRLGAQFPHDQKASADFGLNTKLSHQWQPDGFANPINAFALDFSASHGGYVNPLDPSTNRSTSIGGSLELFDLLRFNVQHNQEMGGNGETLFFVGPSMNIFKFVNAAQGGGK